MSPNQGTVCENDISGVDTVSGGSDDQDQDQFREDAATGSCNRYSCMLRGVCRNSGVAAAKKLQTAAIDFRGDSTILSVSWTASQE